MANEPFNSFSEEWGYLINHVIQLDDKDAVAIGYYKGRPVIITCAMRGNGSKTYVHVPLETVNNLYMKFEQVPDKAKARRVRVVREVNSRGDAMPGVGA